MIRKVLAAAMVALCTGVLPAAATMRHQPVKFMVNDAYELMRPGQPWSGTIQAVAPKGGADVEDFDFAGEGWSVTPVRTGDQRARLAAGDTVTLRLSVQRANPGQPLVVSYRSGDRDVQQTLNLGELMRPRERARSLRQVPAAEAALMAQVPNAEAFARPGLPFDRRSIDAEGLERGMIGDTRIGTSESSVHESQRQATPMAVQARNIRVRGRLGYKFMNAGATLGADGVYFAVYDEDNSWDELLAEGTTDVNGNFDVTFYWDPCFLCDEQPDLYVYFETESDNVICQSPALEWEYSWETSRSNDYAGTDLNLGTYWPGDNESDGVLYTHSLMTRQWRWYNQNGWNVPTIEVQCWDGDGSSPSYYTDIGEIHLNSQRMFFAPTQLHEYGHHWMSEFSNSPSPSYCNGICEAPGTILNCLHCTWCQEDGSVVWTEGFPDFMSASLRDVFMATYPEMTFTLRDYENISTCNGAFDNWERTEGLFAAAIYDLTDAFQDNDTAFTATPSDPIDQLSLSRVAMWQIMDNTPPANARAFFNSVVAQFPANREQIWSTAYNGGVQLDQTAPGAPTGLSSPDHAIGVPSPDATITINFTQPTDDWSGAGSFSIFVGASPAIPDTIADAGDVTSYQAPAMPPGTYYVSVRARDRFGRWSGTFASSGPYVVRPPDPADYTFAAKAGWYRPVVPRNDATATSGTVNVDNALDGNTANTRISLAVKNVGESASTDWSDTQIQVDGDSIHTVNAVQINSGADLALINNGPFTVKGGRHTVGAFADAGEDLGEPNETNNDWARPWVWSPLSITANTLVTRTAAPTRNGGWDAIPAGETKLSNVDGLRFSSSGWWNAVWAYATDMEHDTDVRLHFAASGVDTGFATPAASSARIQGLLDAVLVNRNTLGILPWDVGLLNWDDGASSVRVKHVTSLAVAFNDSNVVSMAADDFLRLWEVSVTAGFTGDVVVTVRTDAESQPLRVQWYDKTFGFGGLNQYVASAMTDSSGFARFTVNVPTTGFYGILVYRDPKDGSASKTFSLQVTRAPADLVAFKPNAWHGPLVPRPRADGTLLTVPLPDTLYGNVAQTYFNVSAKNIGTQTAVATSNPVLVDDVVATTYGFPSWSPNTQMWLNGSQPQTVRGGRHTLSFVLDALGQVEELSDANTWSEQFVWTPLQLVPGTPVTRQAPPARTAGWTTIGTGEAGYLNCDGLRSNLYIPLGHDYYWSAVAVMPGAGTDVDLRMHEIVAGVKNGFKTTVATSAWGTDHSDFVMANFNGTALRQFDIGAIRWSGEQPYTTEAVMSRFRTPNGQGWIGPYTMAPSRILDLHEVYLEAGTWSVKLEPTAGDADMGISLHGATATQGKSTALGTAYIAAGGQYETMLVNAPAPGYYCIAVWKTTSEELGKSVDYRLQVTSPNVSAGDDVPVALSFGQPYPNPARAQASVAFALPAEAAVEIDVYDIEGAHVRSLVRGVQPAGRHLARWDGRGAAGQSLSAGVYYLRFRAGSVVETRKVVLVK